MEMLAAQETIAIVGHEVVFNRLPLAGFPDRWSKDEISAIQQFSDAFFDYWLNSGQLMHDMDLDSVLCMFGAGGIDVAPMLSQLDELSDSDLVDLLHKNWVHPFAQYIPVSPFWGYEPTRKQVWNWYTSDILLSRMERAAMEGSEKALDLYDLIASAQVAMGR